MSAKESIRINSKKVDRPYQCLYVDQNKVVDYLSNIQAQKDHISWREPEYKPIPSYFTFVKPIKDCDDKFYGPIGSNYKALSSY